MIKATLVFIFKGITITIVYVIAVMIARGILTAFNVPLPNVSDEMNQSLQ